LANNKTWKKWTRLGDGGSLSYAEIDFNKPKDEEKTIQKPQSKSMIMNAT
jgi:hypothetical protein